MGNCFGKESSPSSSGSALPARKNNFAGEGRTLGSAPASASIPRPQPSAATAAGGGAGIANGSESTPVVSSQPAANYGTIDTPVGGNMGGAGGDARSAAAAAAEARATKAAQSSPNALEAKLTAQKKQNALQAAAAENLRTREIDAQNEARNWS